MYTPRTLANPISAEAQLLAGKLLQGQVTFLVGAGFSHGDPTSLPLAGELSHALHSGFAGTFADAALQTVDANDLLAVADAIAGSDPRNGLRVLQHYLAVNFPFDNALPNHAHRSLAVLFAERLLTEAMSTNYDTCVEHAAASLGLHCIVPCRVPPDLQQAGGKARFLKLHGCVSNESTMRITTSQLDAPDDWVLGSVIDSATKDTLVIIGINSVAPYVEATLKKVWEYAKDAESVWLVAPLIDENWNARLGTDNKAHQVLQTAEEFLDEVIHACLAERLEKLRQRAEELDSGLPPGSPVEHLTATTSLTEAVKEIPVLALLLALRSGVMARHLPFSAVMGDSGIEVLYGLAILRYSLDNPVSVEQIGGRAWLKLANRVVDFVHGYEAMAAGKLVQGIEADLKDAKARGLLPSKDPILAVASGFVGSLPSQVLPADIVGGSDPESIVDGPERLDITWLRLSDLSRALPDAKDFVLGLLA